MNLGLLGPLVAQDADGARQLGGPKQRLLLAVLALAHPEALGSARLVDALWGDRPPPTATKTVQVFVARLRKALGDGVLVTRAGGYALDLPADAIDMHRFEALLDRGRAELAAGERAAARERLAAALALWRGPALDDLAHEPAVAEHARRLDGLRVDAREARIEADLALGRHAQVVPELEALIAAEPLRERPYGQLMRALYAQGRQAEALDVFQRARTTLVDEVGLEPGPELHTLQERILAQDPELVAAPPVAVTPARPWRRLRRIAVAAAIAAVGAGVIVASGGGRPAPRIAPDHAIVLDGRTGALVDAIPVGAAPIAVVADEHGVWVASAGEQTLERVDPRSRRVTGRIGLGRVPSTIASGEGAVYVASAVGEQGTVARVEPATGSVVSTRVVRPPYSTEDFAPQTPSTVVAAYGAVWSNRGRGSIIRTAVDGGASRRLRLGPEHSADGLAAGAGSIWLASSADDRLLRIDPQRLRVTAAIPIASRPGARVAGPYGVAVGHGAVWVADALAGAVSRVDPRLNAVTATIPAGRRPTRIVAGPSGVWVLDAGAGAALRIDPATNRVTASRRVPQATGLAQVGKDVWVTVAGARAEARAGAAPGAGTVATAGCGRPAGPAGADVTIVSDLPTWLGGRRAPITRDMRRAILTVLRDHEFRAGRHSLRYQACDSSERADGYSNPTRCESNARAIARTPGVVGVIGPYHSACTMIELPILNAAPTGPVAVISPSNTYAGLTRAGPSTAADEPDRFYPTRVRNFARTVRGDDGQGLALGTLARDRGVRRLYLLDDGDGTGYANARYVRQAAAKLGVAIAGSSSWPDGPEGVPAFTRRVVAARPDGVLLAGCFCTGGYEVLAALRRVLPRGTVYLGSDAMLGPWHPASEGLLTTSAGRSAEGADADARRLLRRLGPRRALASFEGFVLEAAAATETLLEAIAGSDGSRGGVVNALQSAKGFDGRGDPVEGVYTVYRHSRSGREHPEREVPGLRFEQTLVVRPR